MAYEGREEVVLITWPGAYCAQYATSMKSCTGQNVQGQHGVNANPTMSGRHIDSHIPKRESGAVPATIKSFAVSMAPMESVPAR